MIRELPDLPHTIVKLWDISGIESIGSIGGIGGIGNVKVQEMLQPRKFEDFNDFNDLYLTSYDVLGVLTFDKYLQQAQPQSYGFCF